MTTTDKTRHPHNPSTGPSTGKDDKSSDNPHARPAETQVGVPDQLCEEDREAESRQEALVDEGVEETFPASDPVSVKRIT